MEIVVEILTDLALGPVRFAQVEHVANRAAPAEDDVVVRPEQQGIDKANILGFSDGGNIALLFALAHPERVDKLVVDGANLNFDGLTTEVQQQILDACDMAQSMGDEQTLDFLRLMTDEPNIDPAQLAALDMPVLVVAGTDDMIKEEHTRLIAQSIPGAQLAIIPGTHFVAYENPDEFNRTVGEFLAQ